MSDQNVVARRWRKLLRTVVVSVAALGFATAVAQQANPSPSPPPAKGADLARDVADLQRDVAQLKSELGLREEIARLRKKLDDQAKPQNAWVEVAPWAVLALVGLFFAIAWHRGNAERDRARQEEARGQRTKMQVEILNTIKGKSGSKMRDQLRARIDTLFTDVAQAATDVDRLASPSSSAPAKPTDHETG